MNTAAAMLAQLNAALSMDNAASRRGVGNPASYPSVAASHWPWSSIGWNVAQPTPANTDSSIGLEPRPVPVPPTTGARLQRADAEAIRNRIMHEMDLLEEERMRRMRVGENELSMMTRAKASLGQSETDDDIIRKELKRDDPSAAIFSEDWQDKQVSVS